MILNLNLTLTLPDWKPEYSSFITEDAFRSQVGKAQEKLIKASQIITAWQRTGDATLFDYVGELLGQVQDDLNLVFSGMDGTDAERLSRQLALLFDLAGALGFKVRVPAI